MMTPAEQAERQPAYSVTHQKLWSTAWVPWGDKTSFGGLEETQDIVGHRALLGFAGLGQAALDETLHLLARERTLIQRRPLLERLVPALLVAARPPGHETHPPTPRPARTP